MAETERRTPCWDEVELRGPRDLVSNIGREGLERLLWKPAGPEHNRADKVLADKLGWMGTKLTFFYFGATVEAADVGFRLGLAFGQLAAEGMLDLTAGDFEDWLQAAIERAGLEGYRPTTRLELPEE